MNNTTELIVASSSLRAADMFRGIFSWFSTTRLCLMLLGIKRTISHYNTIINPRTGTRKRNSDYIYLENISEEETEETSLLNWWKRKKRLLPWNLLEIANSSCPKDRVRAVEALAGLKNLCDYEYQHLAQASTPQTAVSLALVKDVDLRFFLSARSYVQRRSKKELVALMRDLLEELNKKTRHPCLKYFLGNVFPTIKKFSNPIHDFLTGENSNNYHVHYLLPPWDEDLGAGLSSLQSFKKIILCMENFRFNIEIFRIMIIFISSSKFVNDFDMYHEFVGMRWSVTVTPGEETTLSSCIEALLHHCIATGNAKAVVEAGALPLLLSCYKELCNDINACILLSRLIMELSVYPEYLEDLFQTGWIAVLAKWLQNKNQQLSVAAASCLANLDDDSKKIKYEREILLLHPSFRTKQETKIDVVLIHGLLGGVHYTWRQRGIRKEQPISIFGITSPEESIEQLCARATSFVIDEAPHEIDIINFPKKEDDFESNYVFVMSDIPVSEHSSCDTCCSFDGKDKRQLECALNCQITNCWPKDWLPADCNNLRVVGINYDTRLTDWISWCPLRDRGPTRVLAERCRKLLQQLMNCGIGERPVIWIAHSMGGLLVKHMLVQAWKNSHLENMKNFCENTKGVVFLSTPHVGSPWATLHEAWRMLFLPSTEVNELRFRSPVLEKLHDEFKMFINENPMEIISFVETKSVKLTQFEWEIHCVPPNLGDPGFGTIYKIPLGHMDICKPDGKKQPIFKIYYYNCFRFSFIYQRILTLVQNTVNGMK